MEYRAAETLSQYLFRFGLFIFVFAMDLSSLTVFTPQRKPLLAIQNQQASPVALKVPMLPCGSQCSVFFPGLKMCAFAAGKGRSPGEDTPQTDWRGDAGTESAWLHPGEVTYAAPHTCP